MKKVLSFVLVLAMVLGCVSMSFATYSDELAITNKEAVGVLSMLKVLEGDDKGFRPTDTLTRAEACAIIAKLVLGETEAKKLSAPAAPFADVSSGHWAAGYIAYCVSEGYVAGIGNNLFNPNGILKVGEFGKMLLCVLGYDATSEGLVGADWANNTAKLMVSSGINVTQSNGSDCAREVAAQLAFNALKANCVTYPNNGGSITVGGTVISFGKGAANAVVLENENAADYTGSATSTSSGKQQLCEKLYPELKVNGSTIDNFGRPNANTWTYSKNGTKTFIAQKTPKFAYTSKKTAKQVLADLKGYKVSDTAIKATTTTIASVEVPAALSGLVGNDKAICASIAALTANGKLVEVYTNASSQITNIITVDYVVAEVTGKTTASTGNVTYTFSGGCTGSYIDYADDALYHDTLVLGGKVEKGDVVTVAIGADVDNNNAAIPYVYPTTKVTGAQSSYTTDANGYRVITVASNAYTLGYNAGTQAAYVNGETADYYVDQFGYVVKTTALANDNFAYVANVVTKSATTLDSSTVSAQVRVVLSDGTLADYDVATHKVTAGEAASIYSVYHGMTAGEYAIKGLNKNIADAGELQDHVWVYSVSGDKISFSTPANSYAVVGNFGVETLGNASLVKKQTSYTANSNTLLANAATKYVVYNTVDNKVTVYTGAANVPTAINSVANVNAVYKVTKASRAAVQTFFATTGTALSGDTTNYAYVDVSTEVESGAADKVEFAYTAYDKTGAKLTVTAESSLGTDVDAIYNINANNEITSTTPKTSYVTSGAATVDGTLIKVNTEWLNITDTTVTVFVDSTLTTANDNKVVMVLGNTDATAKDVVVIYVWAD